MAQDRGNNEWIEALQAEGALREVALGEQRATPKTISQIADIEGGAG
jgi:hypothetical protein